MAEDFEERIAALEAENARLVEAVAARDAFLAVAAHELRNPMTPILGRVTLLRRSVARGGVSADDVAKGLERIEELVSQFIHRATTLLDLSRADTEQVDVDLQTLDVAEFVAQACENYRPAASHAGALVNLAGCGRAIMVTADPLALQRVLENLLSNAIKYGDGSSVQVHVGEVHAAGCARITIRDDGPGIPYEHQSRIFERYERGVQQGSGIGGYGVGLWIVRTLCTAMGGTVAVASTPGSGCTFMVSLPLLSQPETA